MKKRLFVAGLCLLAISLNAQSRRPEKGNYLVSAHLNPLGTLRYIFSDESSGFGSQGLMINGANVRYYSSTHHSHDIGLSWNYTYTNSGVYAFNDDPNYTVERWRNNYLISVNYAYLWAFDFGEHWQLNHGPYVVLTTTGIYMHSDYSHSKEEFFAAGQRGSYQEGYSYQTYGGELGYAVEVDYFLTNSFYLGFTWRIGGDVVVVPPYESTNYQITDSGITETTTSYPTTQAGRFRSSSGMGMKIGLVF